MPQILRKKHSNVLHQPEFQKNLRQFRNTKVTLKERGQMSGRGLAESKIYEDAAKEKLHLAKRKLAQEQFDGNSHALMLTDLRQETQEMQELLDQVDSNQLVKIRGKQVTLKDFAAKQAFGLSLCSTKAIYQYHLKKKKFRFKHSLRCGRRTCPVCAHFDSQAEGKLMLEELQQQFSQMDKEQLKNGRLYHIVLTHENVPLDQAFEIFKVWRHTQKMKKKEYKKKRNEYDIWNILQWGLWRWEITRNPETGLYHPHIHIIAFVNGWLAPEEGGYWNRLVHSWIDACANSGLNAAWEAQHMGAILYFKQERNGDPRCLSYDFTPEELAHTVEDAVAEMAKYAVKSTDFTKMQRVKDGQDVGEIANEVAMLFAMMSGRKLKNGFGGFSLRDAEESEDLVPETIQEEEEDDPEDLMEAIFTWDKKQKRYIMWAYRNWDEMRFADYLKDMQNYKDRYALTMFYGLERERR